MLESVGSARYSCFWDQLFLCKIGWLVFLLVAGFLLHLPSELGMSLAIPPDSNEYAIGLANLFEHGKFGFTLNGEWYPSRYAPWFSLFCLTPAYFVFGGDVLSLHWAVLAFALAFLVASYKMGRVVGLGRWSYVCAVLPLFIPDFVFYSRMIMTEIPYTAILALSALAFVRFANEERPSLVLCLGCGALVAWGGAVRATALPMLGLFALAALLKKSGWGRRSLYVAIMSFPVMLYEIANLAYNTCVFGSPFRSGYNYWVPVPCDYPEMMFNVDNAMANLSEYVHEPVTLVALALACAVATVSILVLTGRFGGVRGQKNFILISAYILFQGLAFVALYIGYYWGDVRFFLPFMLCLLPLSLKAIMIALGGSSLVRRVVLMVVLLLSVFGFRYMVPLYSRMTWSYPFRIFEAAMTRKVLPDGAVAIQDGSPLLIDWFGSKEKTTELFPVSRYLDYVNAMVAPSPITKLGPGPTSWQQVVVPELIASGACRLPIQETLAEDPNRVGRLLASGRRVFLHVGRTFAAQRGMEERSLKLLERFDLKPFGAWSNPSVDPNPVRHIYDRFIFPSFSMDRLPEVRSIYYEVLPKAVGEPQ
jgi:hypothetical protein